MIVTHATTRANPRNKRKTVFRFIDWDIVTDTLREELIGIDWTEA
jgi:hypothetical protein